MKYLFGLSLLINLVGVIAFGYALNRLGGWTYALSRLRHNESGLYAHRVELFQRLPAVPGSVVMLGDSQVEQCEWAELLHLDSLQVLNRGITGDQTQGILQRLDEVLRHDPAKIFLLVGVNDLVLGSTPDETAERYQSVVAAIRERKPDTELFLLSVLPINNDIKNTGLDPANIRQLNERISRIAYRYALPYIDVYSHLTDPQGLLSVQYSADGIHLNGQGYSILAEKIRHFLPE